MGINVITRLIEHIDEPKTVGAVRNIGKYYRHPDSVLVSYPTAVEKPLGNFPESKDYKIAIVGGGASGVAALYELSRIARDRQSGNITITLYESECDHFTSKLPKPRIVDTFGKRAGRVFAARTEKQQPYGPPKDKSVYEIGAMRFPEIAGLTWHYTSAAFGDDEQIKVFPNPGKVPTEFVFGDRVDRYMGSDWLDNDSPTKKISKVIADGIGGTTKEEQNISLYPIGDKDPAKISSELKDKNTSNERLKEIKEQWKKFTSEYDDVTLESAVRRIIKETVKDLPLINGIEKEEDKINYYVELFGCFGFGTGGFRSLFSMSLVEMMRLILWDYSNEYILPVEENVELFSKLYEISEKNNPNNIVVKQSRVCDVCHLDKSGKALVIYYQIVGNNVENNTPIMEEHDFVILAIPPQHLNTIINRAGYKNTARDIKFGDNGRQTTDTIYARPPLILSKSDEAPNAKIVTAINQVHMITSSKIFGTIKAKIFNEFSPEFKQDKSNYANKSNVIKAIVSDSGLASSYVVPSPLKKSRKIASSEEPEYYSFLISYAWEDDTKRLQHQFMSYPINLESSNPENHERMINTIINHATRHIKDPLDNYNYKPWWFGKLLAKAKEEKDLTDALSYDWTTNHSAGAFKLDMAGGHYNSDLCFRYHTHVLDTDLNNRFFLANDSYSHLGGWLEGAFMSAINAVSAIIVAANGGGIVGLDALTTEARGIIESLEPIITCTPSKN